MQSGRLSYVKVENNLGMVFFRGFISVYMKASLSLRQVQQWVLVQARGWERTWFSTGKSKTGIMKLLLVVPA